MSVFRFSEDNLLKIRGFSPPRDRHFFDAAEEEGAAAEKGAAEDEEAEEDEEEEPSLAASALSMASDNTWSNGSIGSLRLAESLSGTALISLSDITLKSWPGRCHWS